MEHGRFRSGHQSPSAPVEGRSLFGIVLNFVSHEQGEATTDKGDKKAIYYNCQVQHGATSWDISKRCVEPALRA